MRAGAAGTEAAALYANTTTVPSLAPVLLAVTQT
jgi:hypothetical protein